MGKPSDRERAQRRRRLGRRERARAKKTTRVQAFGYVGGAGTFHVRAGRKKFSRVRRYVDHVLSAHLDGDASTPKDRIEIKRPLYTISIVGFTVPNEN